MKKSFAIAWGVYATSILMKLFHVRVSSQLLFLGTILLLILNAIFLFKNAKENLEECIYKLSLCIFALYISLRILFLPVGFSFLFFPIIIYIPIVLAIFYFILYLIRHPKFHIKQLVIFVFTLFSLYLVKTPSFEIYYFFNLSDPINTINREKGYVEWDVYSKKSYNSIDKGWESTHPNLKNQALNANLNAQKNLEKSIKEHRTEWLVMDSILIKRHALEIINNECFDNNEYYARQNDLTTN